MTSILDLPTGALIVSCQAPPGSAIDDPHIIAAIAREAIEGGALALRIEGVANNVAVRATISEPVIGLLKRRRPIGRPHITVDLDACRSIAETGVDMIALDASVEVHPDDDAFRSLLAQVRGELAVPIMADVSTFAEAERAMDAGADWVGTTLSGYTPDTADRNGGDPDFALLAELVAAGYPAVLEGHVRTPEHVTRARLLGARAIVVGTAITNPRQITAAFDGIRA